MLGKITFRTIPKYEWTTSIPILRYVLGISFILLITSLFDYPIAYLTTVLSLSFLAPGTKPLSFKQGIKFIFTLIIINLITFLFSSYFKDYPLVFMPLLCLGILWIYYTNAFPLLIKLFAIISILVLPLLSLEPAGVSSFVAISLVFNAFMAISLTQLIFKVFPWSTADEEFVKEKQRINTSENERYNYAINITLILLPVLLLFFFFKLSGSLLILIFIGILSMSPALANAKVGKFLIVANILGGLFAIIAYQLLTFVPLLPFMILLTLIVGFFFGSKLFSKRKLAPIFGTSLSTFLLILGSVTASNDVAASAVWSRLIQISLAVIYVVIAFRILNYFLTKKQKTL